MPEYISRAEALRAVQKQRGANRSPAQNAMLDRIRCDIKNMPAADVAPVVHGERELAETGKLVPRFYGDYVFSPCQNAFNGKTSWWLSKKDCTVAIYCFTAGTTDEVDAQLSAGGGQAYIQMFEERTGYGGSKHE